MHRRQISLVRKAAAKQLERDSHCDQRISDADKLQTMMTLEEEEEQVQKRKKKSERKKRCRRGRRCGGGTDHASEDDECWWECSSIHVAPAPRVTHPQG